MFPKHGEDPTKPQSCRPILLLKLNNKLFSSLFVARLRTIMRLIVHPSQTYSVLGWTITSALSLTCDPFGFAARIGLRGLFVGLERDKAFEVVEHDYLFAVLGPLCFPQSFVDLLRELCKGLSSDLTVNASCCFAPVCFKF